METASESARKTTHRLEVLFPPQRKSGRKRLRLRKIVELMWRDMRVPRYTRNQEFMVVYVQEHDQAVLWTWDKR